MLSEIKYEIKTVMSGVNDVYNNYTEKKYVKEPSAFFELFKVENILGDNIITAWFIERTETTEQHFSTAENIRDHTIVISGYLGICENDNSARKFENIIEDICSVFRNNQNLNGKCMSITPVQVKKIEEKYLGSILCHYAELKFNCKERVFLYE